jgi:hypothetical protein
MKKILVILIILVFIGGLAWSQDSNPRAAITFNLGGAFLAPIGVGVEFFVPPLGIVGEVRGLFAAYEGTAVGAIEPGAYARVYFNEIDSSLFAFGGVSYMTLWDSDVGTVDAGILKPKAGLGYGALFGDSNRIRFFVELGGMWWKPVIEGSILDTGALLLPHFLLGFGGAF